MGNFKSLPNLEKVLVPIIADLGLTFVDLDIKKISGQLTLTVYIDKQGGVTLDDCELVSKAIDLPLDEFDVTNGESYNLNVSSPGIDRPLKKASDFERNLNCEIEVKFFAPLNGKKVIVGVLKSYTEDKFVIMSEAQELEIDIKLTALIKPVIKF